MTSRKAKKTAGIQPDVQPIELGTVTTWPLDQLAISNLNVRKHGGLDGVDELAIDIEAKGLLQSLIVHPGPAGPEDKGRLVAGGQRRYLALCHLAKAGKIAADAPIAVRDVPEDVAIEASLSENIQRKDMTPADEFRAFKALIETGRYNAQQIADRFGFKKAHVARRLRLAELIPEILEALEAGKFGIESAMAYAAAATPEQQLKIFKAQERSNYDKHKPASILSAINTGGSTPTATWASSSAARRLTSSSADRSRSP
jgi:ParB family chromosome partitioning protein